MSAADLDKCQSTLPWLTPPLDDQLQASVSGSIVLAGCHIPGSPLQQQNHNYILIERVWRQHASSG